MRNTRVYRAVGVVRPPRAVTSALGVLILLVLVACATDLNVGSNVTGVSSECTEQPCGTSCALCDSTDSTCAQWGLAGFCDRNGACVPGVDLRCYDQSPCERQTCGHGCWYCNERDSDCVEPEWDLGCHAPGPGYDGGSDCGDPWPKVCNAFGNCIPTASGYCQDPTSACKRLDCGDYCCPNNDCQRYPFGFACDADGACVPAAWASCL